MGAEIVPQALNEVRRQPLAPISVEIREARRYCGYRQAVSCCRTYHIAQVCLAAHGELTQDRVEEQVLQSGRILKGIAYRAQHVGADDASASPDPGHRFQVQTVTVRRRGFA